MLNPFKALSLALQVALTLTRVRVTGNSAYGNGAGLHFRCHNLKVENSILVLLKMIFWALLKHLSRKQYFLLGFSSQS